MLIHVHVESPVKARAVRQRKQRSDTGKFCLAKADNSGTGQFCLVFQPVYSVCACHTLPEEVCRF